jgi:DNA-binding HxlR family transcriptional regulator
MRGFSIVVLPPALGLCFGNQSTPYHFDFQSMSPRPGQPVRGSKSGRPIMALLDLLGRRWALRVIWELRAEGETLNFRRLQERCGGISSSVLNDRLTELRDAGIVERGDRGYRLSAEGRRLLEAFEPLAGWAQRWGDRSG